MCRLPIMIETHRWEVLGSKDLKYCSGKTIVNSISLKEGEEQFKLQAKIKAIRSCSGCYGVKKVRLPV